MNQFVDSFAKLPLPQKLIVLTAIIAIVGLAYVFLGYFPLQDQLTELRKTENELNIKVKENRAIAQNKDRYIDELAALDEELKQALELLPNDSDIRSLLRQFSSLQDKTDVKSLMFKPAGEVKKGFYAEIPIQLRLEGSYHDIAMFFDRIGKLDRIVNIQDIEMSNPKEQNGKTNLSVSCMATTFKFTGGAGLPSPGRSKKSRG